MLQNSQSLPFIPISFALLLPAINICTFSAITTTHGVPNLLSTFMPGWLCSCCCPGQNVLFLCSPNGFILMYLSPEFDTLPSFFYLHPGGTDHTLSLTPKHSVYTSPITYTIVYNFCLCAYFFHSIVNAFKCYLICLGLLVPYDCPQWNVCHSNFQTNILW